MTGGGECLAIVAAGGSVPVHVAEAARAAGRPVFVIGLDGVADERLRAFPHEMLKWGQLGRARELLAERHVGDLVLIGTVKSRPDFANIKVDLGAVRLLPKVLALLVGGDDSLLRGVVKLIEDMGYRVVGAHEIAPDLVARRGFVVGRRLSAAARADVGVAFHAARAVGGLDIGQAVVSVGRRVVAVEGAEGTDALIERVGVLKASGRVKWTGRSGVLAKCARPNQDLRVDMPTIGPATVEAVARVGLAGIAIEAGRVMIADRPQTVALAEQTDTFIIAEDDRDPVDGG
jgi:hypothetical protein